MNLIPKILLLLLLSITLTFCDLLFAFPQTQDQYEKILREANQNYRTGKFDEAISLLNDCLIKPDITDNVKISAYRILGLVYIAKDNPDAARKSVKIY